METTTSATIDEPQVEPQLVVSQKPTKHGGETSNLAARERVWLIGLCGYAGSGKDTVARILREDYDFEQFAFADGVRELLYEINPYLVSVGKTYREVLTIYGYERAKRTYSEIRDWLVRIGQGARNAIGEDVWVRRTMDRIFPSSKPPQFRKPRRPPSFATDIETVITQDILEDPVIGEVAKHRRVRQLIDDDSLVNNVGVVSSTSTTDVTTGCLQLLVGTPSDTISTLCGYRAVVVSDVRYQNEADAIVAAGGTIWYISRPGYNGLEQERKTMQHVRFNKVITNDSTITALRSKLLDAL